ncbi:MAG: DUF1127 domain-containing protein [Tabrizicola sp.]|nr:DUF1127 domain-containing protein [Tabrizicola sp.]
MPLTQVQNAPLRRKSNLLQRALELILRVEARRRDRQRLGTLDAHLLRDIGIDPNAAQEECAKPFWRS